MEPLSMHSLKSLVHEYGTRVAEAAGTGVQRVRGERPAMTSARPDAARLQLNPNYDLRRPWVELDASDLRS
ncbi:hypothetical protein RR48_14554 [Papilio machaon]|uniref:Uncharacterized protein n=1 Tax=Papilio machaon TaxID=76193 RepID=A0A194QKR2_PAPMA|nr:hypothetical protein RR48_14554 [Papilio machaon]